MTMDTNMSSELADALRSDCGNSFESVLKKKDPQDFGALIAIAADKAASASRRSTAIFMLGAWGDAEAVETIALALPELPDRDKLSALDALGRLGSPAALKAIRRFTNVESADVRKFAVNALGRIGSPEALQTLQEIQERDSVEFVRKAAERYLKKR